MKRITQTKEIQSGDNSGIVVSGNEKVSYSKVFTKDDFTANELITFQAVNELIGSQVPPSSTLQPWNSSLITNADNYVTHIIGGNEYLFRSDIDNNTSEPSFGSEGFEGIQAWDNKGNVDYTLWNGSETYSINQWVLRDATGFGLGYRFYSSIINGNINNDPLSDPDEGGTHWKLEGVLVTPFVVGNPYKKKDIHQATDGTIYISLIPNNIYDLTELAPPWTQINTTDPINTWSSLTTYNKNRCVRRTFSDGTTTFNYVWQSLIDGNLDINPISDNGVNWRFVGQYKANFDSSLTYSLYNVVIDPSDSSKSYVSNMDGNNYQLDTIVSSSSWALVGIKPLDYTAENITNKATDFTTSNDILYPSVKAVKTYADALVYGLLNDRGNWDASGNIFPNTGGSGTSGAIMKGNLWYINVAGTLGGQAVNVGDWVRALVDSPAQISANWSIAESNFGFVPENVANKQNSLVVDGSGVKYPTVDAVNAGLANYALKDDFCFYRSNIEIANSENTRNDQSSIIELTNGDLLIAYSHFKDDPEDDDESTIYGAISTDRGQTWGTPFELIPKIELGTYIPSLYTKADGKILCIFHVLIEGLPESISEIYKIEFNQDLTVSSVATPIYSLGYTAPASDRIFKDEVNNKLLFPYAKYVSGGFSSVNSIYEGRFLISSDDGVTWNDAGISIGTSVLAPDGFGGAQEPGFYYDPTKGLVFYFRTIIGDIYASNISYSGSYIAGSSYALGIPSMNATSSIKYWGDKKVFIAAVMSLIGNNPLSYSLRQQIDLLTSIDGITWNRVNNVSKSYGSEVLNEPNIFIDEKDNKIIVSYSESTKDNLAEWYDLKANTYPLVSLFGGTTDGILNQNINYQKANAKIAGNIDILNTTNDYAIKIIANKINDGFALIAFYDYNGNIIGYNGLGQEIPNPYIQTLSLTGIITGVANNKAHVWGNNDGSGQSYKMGLRNGKLLISATGENFDYFEDGTKYLAKLTVDGDVNFKELKVSEKVSQLLPFVIGDGADFSTRVIFKKFNRASFQSTYGHNISASMSNIAADNTYNIEVCDGTTTGAKAFSFKGDGALIVLTNDGSANSVIRNADLSTYAPLASPTLTGTPTAPTATAGTNTAQIATTAFVQSAIAANVSQSTGTWTPSGSVVSNILSTYVKTGKLVVAYFKVAISTNSSTSTLQIGGLPFTSSSADQGAVTITWQTKGISTQITGLINGNNTIFSLFDNSGNAYREIDFSNSTIQGMCTYYTD